MADQAPKLVDLTVFETSGVDHPAHMREGWVVMKASEQEANEELRRMSGAPTNTEDNMPDVDVSTLSPEAQAVIGERDATIKELGDKVAELTEAVEKAAAGTENGDPTPDTLPDDVVKSLPESVRTALTKAQADAEAATAAANEATSALQKEREQAAEAQAVEKAKGWGNLGIDAKEFGPLLRKAAKVDADLGAKLESTLTALSTQVSTGELFKEKGTGGGDTETGAQDELVSKARKLMEDGVEKSMPAAMRAVAKSHPDLYERSRAEKGA